MLSIPLNHPSSLVSTFSSFSHVFRFDLSPSQSSPGVENKQERIDASSIFNAIGCRTTDRLTAATPASATPLAPVWHNRRVATEPPSRSSSLSCSHMQQESPPISVAVRNATLLEYASALRTFPVSWLAGTTDKVITTMAIRPPDDPT